MISRTKPDTEITFAQMARDHGEHAHCVSCQGCVIDPADHVRFSSPIWCVGCRDRAKANLKPGQRAPWLWEAP